MKSLKAKESGKGLDNKFNELKKLSDSLQEFENPIIVNFVLIDN